MAKDLARLGSMTARNGFRNERDIADKFNRWASDREAQQWLEIMGYPLREIEKVIAVALPRRYKADVQVQITVILRQAIAAENLSVKLVSNPQGFNQVDKRTVDSYQELWGMDGETARLLKLFTGETIPQRSGLRDARRMYFDEMTEVERSAVIGFFRKKRILIVTDLLKGRGKLSAGWMLVTLNAGGSVKWVLKSINEAMNTFGCGEVEFTAQGNLRIGRIGMQRKGGTPDPTKLQFKINPVDLFDD